MRVISKNIGCGKTTDLINSACKYATETDSIAYILSSVPNEMFNSVDNLLKYKGTDFKANRDAFTFVLKDKATIKVIHTNDLAEIPLKRCLFIDNYDLFREEVFLGHLSQIHTLTVTPTKEDF